MHPLLPRFHVVSMRALSTAVRAATANWMCARLPAQCLSRGRMRTLPHLACAHVQLRRGGAPGDLRGLAGIWLCCGIHLWRQVPPTTDEVRPRVSAQVPRWRL